MLKCPECGRFLKCEDYDELHGHCNKCDLFFCFEEGCHCGDGLKIKREPLTKDKSQSISVLYDKMDIKSGINPFGWYHSEDIKSAVDWLKERFEEEFSKDKIVSSKREAKRKVNKIIDEAFDI